MELLLNKIIKECAKRDIQVEVLGEKNGHMSYTVKGFSKSGKADLYIEDGAIICETRYGKKEHVLSFRDLVHVAHYWFLAYKDRAPFQMADPEWDLVFKEFIGTYHYTKGYEEEDLPF